MLRMFRLRRYRVFVLFALLIVVLLFKFTRRIGGDGYTQGDGLDLSLPLVTTAPPKPIQPVSTKETAQELPKSSFLEIAPSGPRNAAVTQSFLPDAASDQPKPVASLAPTVPPVVLPDRKISTDQALAEDEEAVDDIHPIGPPGRQEFPSFAAVPTTIHWEKQIEHFPVPTESIIQLPTGSPVFIPKIQHKFNDETPDAKINREKRQVQVKEEFKKAWTGYKKHAWMHDELSPKSGKFRDPFCGWAATLVDTLDTLWIMGLEEEFEEAARAVEQIDFTTSPRGDIPLFETTIRYLGGLLAAYDVSGEKYKTLLDKAVELGDILLGAFDTPNRMPILFYRWKPTFASQPHRANERSNLAELGSLSMEFTRLAQLTNNPRYYDAVARVTNALSEYQDRGTKLGSVFPDNVDASGCNRTIPHKVHEPIATSQDVILPPQTDEAPQGYEPKTPGPLANSLPNELSEEDDSKAADIVEIKSGESDEAYVAGWDEVKGPDKAGSLKRDLSQVKISNRSTSAFSLPKDSITGLPRDLMDAKSQIGDILGDWDCIPQGLSSSTELGMNKFSMGGGQDSTYEYFPKQYILLGGREALYKKLYLKTIADVRKWMLYRPMLPDNRDILFSGAVTTSGRPETDLKLIAEVQHLTCFIGGMIGMGAKIFDIETDLELAKRLADGCVWAYESMPSGIMPEGATVIPCESNEHCTWNETAYFHFLDPIADDRDKLIEQYDAKKLAESIAAEIQATQEPKQASLGESEIDDYPLTKQTEGVSTLPGSQAPDSMKSDLNPANEQSSIQKRQSSLEDLPLKDDIVETSATSGKISAGIRDAPEGSDAQVSSGQGALLPEMEMRNVDTSETEAPLSGDLTATPTSKDETQTDPLRPLSHKEFVDARIKQAALPPGFVSIKARKYILRPEAIESVWYMYRITGDATWQDKGWIMFESIIDATSTKYGHSAISDVTIPRNKTYQTDEMESFWLAETLKYFYLLYSTPDTISLDDWVLNTEAHPFKRES